MNNYSRFYTTEHASPLDILRTVLNSLKLCTICQDTEVYDQKGLRFLKNKLS